VDEHLTDPVTLYHAPTRPRCAEYALVLRAVGIACEVLPVDGGFALTVAGRDAVRGREQLGLYRAENPPRPPRPDPRQRLADGINCASLYGATILILDLMQRHQAFSLDWWEAGKAQAWLIRDGEWWRTLTALGLHADPVHLAGNLLFGIAFGFLAGQLLGWGLAWCGLLLAGALGNALNALIQPATHTSVGASTAVFAALGILAFHAWRGRQRPINRWVPVGGGVALLAFLGMGGERTDIFAHVAGFGAGGLLGVLIAQLGDRLGPLLRHQLALALAGLSLLVLAWVFAFLGRG
jgi:membrane associated rhomboid family serine protease